MPFSDEKPICSSGNGRTAPRLILVVRSLCRHCAISNHAIARHYRIDLQIDHDATVTRQRSVWLLLNRHIADTRRKDEYISLSIGNDDSAASDLDSIKVCYMNEDISCY